MSKRPEELTYFCVFDPNTGSRLGSYIAEFQTVPSGAISVSYTDYKLYISDNNWRYDWDKKEPTYVTELDDLPLETLVERAQEAVNLVVNRLIAAGFTYMVKGGFYTFDCELEDQINLQRAYTEALAETDETAVWMFRARKAGEDYKRTIELNADEVQALFEAMSTHITSIREKGFNNKTYVTKTERTVEELKTFILRLQAGGNLREY